MRREGTKQNIGETACSHVSEFLNSSAHPKSHFPKNLLTSKVDNPRLTALPSNFQPANTSPHLPLECFYWKASKLFLLRNRCEGWSRGPPEAEYPCIPLNTFPTRQCCDSIIEMRLDSSLDNLQDKEGVDKIRGQSPHTQFWEQTKGFVPRWESQLPSHFGFPILTGVW